MATITSGRVVYSRTVQPEQYGSERAECELSFVIEDGEDPDEVLEDVLEIVKHHALETIKPSRRGKSHRD